MLRALKELFIPEEPMSFVRVGSSWPVEVPQSIILSSMFTSPERNLVEAQKEGIRPVNMHTLLEQFSPEQIHNSVLFDSTPNGVFPGNHWRILYQDDGHSLITLQLCGGPFGNHDAQFPPLTISQYDILFTGMSTQRYEKNGRPISLDDVNHEKNTKQVKWIGETIYWADANGKLAPTGKRRI